MRKKSSPADVLRSVAQRRGGLSALAKDLKLPGIRPVGTVWAWIDRNHTPPEHAAEIEKMEGGKVTVEQLTRGVRWKRMANPDWPHPDGEPVVAVAREAA